MHVCRSARAARCGQHRILLAIVSYEITKMCKYANMQICNQLDERSVRVSAMVMVSYVLNSVDMFWRF